MRHLKRTLALLLTGLLIVATVLAATFRLWSYDAVTVTFTVRQKPPINCSVFYTEQDGKFDANHKVKATIVHRARGGRYTLRAELPAKHLHRLRLDFGSSPGTVKLTGLTVSGDKTVNIELTPAAFRYNSHIEKYRSTPNGIAITSHLKDPFIVLKKTLDIAPTTQIHYPALILLVTVTAFLYGMLLCMRRSTPPAFLARKAGKTFENVDFLRIVFTLMVVCNHFILDNGGISYGGQYAVCFFFILSGYLLAVTYKPERTFGAFAMQKLIRWIPLIVAGALLCGGGAKSLYNILLIQDTGLGFTCQYNAPAWYLGVLFWVSLFLFTAIRSLSTQQCRLLIGTLTFLSFVFCIQSGSSSRTTLVCGYIPVSLLRGMAGGGLGYLLAQCCRRPATPLSLRWDASAAEIALLLYIGISAFVPRYLAPYAIMIPASTAALLFLFIRRRGLVSCLLERRIFSLGSRYALAVYLTHYALTSQGPIARATNEWCLSITGSPELGLVLILPCSIVLGVAAHHLVEHPAARILNHWYKGLQAKEQ